jgi:hypothetical protein
VRLWSLEQPKRRDEWRIDADWTRVDNADAMYAGWMAVAEHRDQGGFVDEELAETGSRGKNSTKGTGLEGQ